MDQQRSKVRLATVLRTFRSLHAAQGTAQRARTVCFTFRPVLILIASVISGLAATEVEVEGGRSCNQWNTEAFFRLADVNSVALCLKTRDPNETGEGGFTPLHLTAYSNGNAAIVDDLISAGADVEARDDQGRTPVYLAAALNDNAAVVDALIAADADVSARNNFDYTPLQEAAWNNANPDVLKALVAAGGDTEARLQDGRSLLHLAAQNNQNPEVLRFLLANGGGVGARDDDGNTPLHLAARSNENEGVLHFLLAHGSDVGARDADGATPLHHAARFNDNAVSIIEALLARGSNPNARDADGSTPLHEAAHRLFWPPTGPDRKTERQHFLDESASIVVALLAAGANPNAKNGSGWAPLAVAVEDLGAASVKALIDSGAEISDYMLVKAAGNEEPEVLQALIVNGADIAKFGAHALHRAAWMNGNPEVVDVLLAAGTNVHERDEQGRNALHHAAAYESRGLMIRKLAAAGANIEARDRNGNTPLHSAAEWARDWSPEDHAGDSISALLDLGANPVARNGKGRTPWDLAEENEALKGTDAYWQLNDARFAAPGSRETSANPEGPPREATTSAAATQPRECEIPGYPSPNNVETLGLSWCGSNVGIQRRAFALQAAGAWCAIASGSSSSAEQVADRHREINAACERLDAMQSPDVAECKCPTGYRP